MRYYYEVSKKTFAVYGQVYKCNHPMHNKCTLYKDEDYGMAVIQQRFNKDLKHTWWSSIDIELVDDIYETPGFKEFFKQHATIANENGLYFTIEVRKLMWALRMKPLKRQYWES